MADEDDLPTEMVEEPIDLGSEEQTRKRKRDADEHDAATGRFWRTVLSDPVGRSAMWEWLTAIGTFAQPFGISPDGSPDPQMTLFLLGKREAGQQIYLTLLKHDFEGTNAMIREFEPRITPEPTVRRRAKRN